MKITDLSTQVRNPDRINISVDGKYRFSLTVAQVVDLGLRRGAEYTEEEIAGFEAESTYGKLYARALEYCLMRPHSSKEVRDYLWRKTRTSTYRSRRTGELKERAGVSEAMTARVYARLVDKGYVDDHNFARYWVEHRNMTKGASQRKLTAELRAKGVDQAAIDAALAGSERSEDDELRKVLAKKRARYPDPQKLIQYLMRKGFGYDDIRRVLAEESTDSL